MTSILHRIAMFVDRAFAAQPDMEDEGVTENQQRIIQRFVQI